MRYFSLQEDLLYYFYVSEIIFVDPHPLTVAEIGPVGGKPWRRWSFRVNKDVLFFLCVVVELTFHKFNEFSVFWWIDILACRGRINERGYRPFRKNPVSICSTVPSVKRCFISYWTYSFSIFCQRASLHLFGLKWSGWLRQEATGCINIDELPHKMYLLIGIRRRGKVCRNVSSRNYFVSWDRLGRVYKSKI